LRVFDDALAAFEEQLRCDPHVTGLAVSGSYVRGNLGPYSDIDVYVVLSARTEGTAAWSCQWVLSVELECFRYTVEEYSTMLDERRRIRDIVHPLATAIVRFDGNGELSCLVQKAKQVIAVASACRPLEVSARASIERATLFGYRKVGNAYCRGDWLAFHYHMGHALHLLPSHLAALAGESVCPDPLRFVQQADPVIFEALQVTLTAPAAKAKWDSYVALLTSNAKRYGWVLPQPHTL
jgi:predicted nucleotidyltransferase